MTELACVPAPRGRRALWGTAVEVTAVRPLPGGASRESWDVGVPDGHVGRRPARRAPPILLRDAGGRGQAAGEEHSPLEAAAMIAARAAGVFPWPNYSTTGRAPLAGPTC